MNPIPFEIPGAEFVTVWIESDWPAAEHDFQWTTPADWQETCRKVRAILIAGGVHSFYRESCTPEDVDFRGYLGDYKIGGYSILENASPEAQAAGLFDELRIAAVHRAYGWR